MKHSFLLPVMGLSSAFVIMGVNPDAVSAATFGINWTGSNNYTLTGQFTINDSLLGTGAINGTQVDTFGFEVFNNAVSEGTWTLGVDTGDFNFNFDTTTGQFIVGGDSFNPDGQEWGVVNSLSSGVGFVSGSFSQSVYLDGNFIDSSAVLIANSNLTATRIPEPAPLAGILGLTVLAVVGRKRK